MSPTSAVLEPLAPDLWVARRPLPLIVGDIGARMTVVRLRDGSLVLHSPVHPDDETRAALDALGPVRAVIAPNLHHHFFVGGWARACPAARIYGAPGLARKKPDLRLDAELGDEAPPEWRGELDQHVFRGAPAISEVVFHHRASRTAIFTDLVFNVPRGSARGARLFYWLVGAEGRFGPHRVVRLGIRDRRAARASLETLLAWDVERIVMSHGEVIGADARSHLAAAFAFLPPPA
jgi:Domain of unknown function (DUF4336)